MFETTSDHINKFHQNKVENQDRLAETLIGNASCFIIPKYITQKIELAIDLLCETSLMDRRLSKCPHSTINNKTNNKK